MKKILLAYKNMIGRCYLTTHQAYKNYGGRGVGVCNEWRESREAFIAWALSNGHGDGLSLDRIDNDGQYSPENCRWVDQKTQQNNRRSNCVIEYLGQAKTLTQWAEQIGIKWDVLWRRLNVYKMPLDRAMQRESLRKKLRHGTRAMYENHKCKCDQCRAANTERHKMKRKQKNDLIGYAAIAAELGDVSR
jgi:hypothetical protein